MKPERWRQIEELYHAALERAPDERAAFLAAACNGDQSLREEVESLLAYDSCSEHFITSPLDEVAAAIFAAEGLSAMIGQSLGHYRIVLRLGQGGMGEVYLAEDTRLGRRVAVKLLPAEFTRDAGRVRRFEQEARAASALNHPNILTIHEIGTVEQHHFIVSEFVEGETLRQRMKSGPLELAAALEIAAQVASALAEAHRAGIVHRDIKPENVMLRPDGLVKVLDFGLAKLTAPPAPAADLQASTVARLSTETGVVMGTPHYMSPEQARGQKVDARTDIFSLGAVLYEMLSGSRPFAGATASDVIAALLTAEPSPLRQHCAEATAELEQVVSNCLAKQREARYQAAEELLAELKKLRLGGQPETAATTRKPGAGGMRFALRRSFVILALAVVFVVGLTWLLSQRRASTVQPNQIRSLAVLPLENLSGDPQQEYFADGMTDALIGDLARIGALRVISRTSAMYYKGTKKPLLPEIARELKVDAVVEGTVQRTGDRLLVRVQLIQAATDQHLWAEDYERDLRDVLAVQQEVAQAIARAVKVIVTPQEQAHLASARQVNPAAYEAYLQARYVWNKRTPATLKTAAEHFERAISLDPNYAPAYAGLADAYSMRSDYDELAPREAYPKAKTAALRALALDAELAEAHTALAWITAAYEWNFDEAERGFQRALALNPNYATAQQWYAEFLSAQGRHAEAIAALKRAQQSEPFSLIVNTALAGAYYFARQDDEAIAACQKVIELDPNFAQVYDWLLRAYANKRMVSETLATHQKFAALMGWEGKYLANIRRVESVVSMQEYWRKRLAWEMEEAQPFPFWVAECWAQLGNKEQAFVWLEKLCQERNYWAIYLNVVPTLDPLRTDPRFTDLLRRIGLAQ